MRPLFLCLSIALSQCTLQAADEFHFLDIAPFTNQKLTDDLGRGIPGNHLKELPTGEQTFANVEFRVGDGIIQLGSTVLDSLPGKIEGIPVARQATKIHFLHATSFGGGPNKSEEDALFVKDNTLIGAYVVRYEDQTTESVPIVYGKNVRDWWYREDEMGVKEGEIAWTGDNPWATANQCRLRLYATTWENPKPSKKILSIDYLSRKNATISAPFCIAITTQSDSGTGDQ